MRVGYVKELNPVSLIAGDTHEFQYDVYDLKTGEAIEGFAAEKAHVYIYKYGYFDNPVVILDMELVSGTAGTFVAKVDTTVTTGLEYGLYVHQPVFVDNEGNEFRPCQGTLNVLPGKKNDSYLAEGWPSGEGAYY